MTETPTFPEPANQPDQGDQPATGQPTGPGFGAPPPGFSQAPPRQPVARLQRSSSDRIIAGVCGGLGRHFGVDPILFRVGFVALVFAAGTGVLLYLALAILMPSDDGQQIWQRGAGNRSATDGEPANGGSGVYHAPVPKAPRSPVPGVTIAVLLIGLGVLALAQRFGDWALLPSAYFAIAVAIVGVGLLVSAFGPWRRNKAGLITLGVILSFGLFVTSAVDDRGGFDSATFGEHNYQPRTPADIQHSYRVLMGASTLDLSRVDFTSIDATEIDIEVTMGSMQILLPPEADVRFNGATSFGSVSVFGQRNLPGGFYPGTSTASTTAGTSPDLVLNLDVRFGDAQVRRVG